MSRDKPLVLSDYGLREEFKMPPEDSQEGSVFHIRDSHQGFGFRDGDSGSEFETLPDDQNQDSVISDGGQLLLIKETPNEDSELLMQIPDEKERSSCSQELSHQKSSEEKQDGRDANKFQPSTEKKDFKLVFSMGLKIIEYDDATTRRLYKYPNGRLCIIAQNKKEPKWNMSEDEFVIFVKGKDFPYIRRPDKLQKRCFSILTWCLQHQYKRSLNLLTSEVHEKMREVYGLEEMPIEYSHIFGKLREKGMHSIACKTIQANDKLRQDLIDQLYEAYKVSNQRSKTSLDHICQMFEKDPSDCLGYLTGAKLIEKKKDGATVIEAIGLRSVKLPWQQDHNLNGIVSVVKKLYYMRYRTRLNQRDVAELKDLIKSHRPMI